MKNIVINNLLILTFSTFSMYGYQRYCQLTDETKLWGQKSIPQPDYMLDQVVILLPQVEQARYTCFVKLDIEERHYLSKFLDSYQDDMQLNDELLDNLEQRNVAQSIACIQIIKDFIDYKKVLGQTVGQLREKLNLPKRGMSESLSKASKPAEKSQPPQQVSKNAINPTKEMNSTAIPTAQSIAISNEEVAPLEGKTYEQQLSSSNNEQSEAEESPLDQTSVQPAGNKPSENDQAPVQESENTVQEEQEAAPPSTDNADEPEPEAQAPIENSPE